MRHFTFVLSALLFSETLSLSAQDMKSYDQTIQGTAIKFRMVAIPGGKFLMGNNQTSDESPAVTVEVSPFWMEEHEVTFAEWDGYFKDVTIPQAKNIDGVTRATPQYIDLTWGMGRDAMHPSNSMSQQAAMMYCQWLYSKTGFFFRLPTEAEWEFACKAGQSAGPAEMNSLQDVGYFSGNSQEKFHHVKEKKPNAWGLYDMLGNLSEWTIDQYDPGYYKGISHKDPITVPAGRYPRTARGGSYLDVASELTCSNRIPSEPRWNQRDPQIPKSRWWLTDGMFVGFRVVRPLHQPSRNEIENFYALYNK